MTEPCFRVRQLRPDLNEDLFRVEVRLTGQPWDHAASFYFNRADLTAAVQAIEAATTATAERSLPSSDSSRVVVEGE